jgi:adenylate cyclase
MTHWEDARWGWSDSRNASLDLAEEAARSAESIDHNYPGYASVLGLTYLMRGRHDEAIAMMEKAVRLAPNHAANVALYALSLNLVGKPGESIRQIKRAMRLSPIYPAWYLVPLAVSYILKGELNRAHDTLTAAIDRDPELNLPRIWLAYTLVQQGRQEDAENQAQIILNADPNFSVSTWSEGINFKDVSWNKRFEQGLREAMLSE